MTPLSLPSPATSFGGWLRQRRRALGFTHATLAERVHCSVSALRKFEQDVRRPSRPLAERLADRLGVTQEERMRFLAFARGERRVDTLESWSPVPLAPVPAAGDAGAGADVARPREPWSGLYVPFGPTTPSIAVLPFSLLSADPGDELFADGLADELVGVLSKIPGLRVASRASAFEFKGKTVDHATIARNLNVAGLVEGSVRRCGTRVRIRAQFIDVASDTTFWSESYDRELSDLIDVQDDIARSVVTGLRGALPGEPESAAADRRVDALLGAATRGRTRSARAHELYLRGRFLVDRTTPEDTAAGIEYGKQAVEADPRYALAWAGLAGAYASQAAWGWAPLGPTFELAREAAEHALGIEPDLPEAHAELAWIRMTYDWNWHGAEQSYRRALLLGSGNRSIVVGASLLADNLGQSQDAVALARRAVDLDPMCSITHGNLALRAFNAGLLDEAAAAAATSLTIHPRGGLVHWLMGTILLAQGRVAMAREAFEREEHERLRLQGRALAAHAAGDVTDARRLLDELIATGADDSAFQIAEVLAVRGEVDAAFEWLERSRVQRDPGASQAQAGPLLKALHGDPRWRAFLVRMGFAGGGRAHDPAHGDPIPNPSHAAGR
ncbi:MAG TPA: helix-turn-helix domain-containing protein [Casimicrobiaceae bacterium]|nr:helix-turn-helix domain-containing protein [Casimicrobiaceae bacterium]